MTRTYYAPAKINLWLRVFPRDDTGYHPLDTLFCAIDLSDRIEIAPGDEGIHLDVHGPDLGPTEKNLAYRAAHEYYHGLGITPAIRIALHKAIPVGAGLGGGSSDAAAVLRGLQELHDSQLPEQDLLAIAARLGSDVPFFVCATPFARATGRGEVLTALPPLKQRSVLVVMPPFAIATRDAYQWLDEGSGRLEYAAGINISPQNWRDVERVAMNDFEYDIFTRYPYIERICDAVRASGAAIALLSGSGSAIFGVYRAPGRAERARAELAARFKDVAIYSAKTLA